MSEASNTRTAACTRAAARSPLRRSPRWRSWHSCACGDRGAPRSVADDALRLWAGASTAGRRRGADRADRCGLSDAAVHGDHAGRLASAPAGTPAPALRDRARFRAVRRVLLFARSAGPGVPAAAAAAATLLIAFHPALLRAVVAGPGDMFLAAFC